MTASIYITSLRSVHESIANMLSAKQYHCSLRLPGYNYISVNTIISATFLRFYYCYFHFRLYYHYYYVYYAILYLYLLLLLLLIIF